MVYRSGLATTLLLSLRLTAAQSDSTTIYSNASTSVTSISGTTAATAPATTTIDVSVEDLWDLFVGSIAVAATNTTISATPVPSSELIPPPPLHYAAFPSGQQNPATSKNSSWAFPKDFWWGVASAAYQVEGAAKDEGRGPSIWDVLTHRGLSIDYVVNNDTGDIADNQYYMYKQDIARIAALGTKVYSFSISWSRILPYGRGPVNEQGLKHYEDVIDTCLEYGVTPAVTLYHWDLPLYLMNLYGGWLSEEIVDDFTNYASIVFSRYGNKVGHWFTVNEPIVFCEEYPYPPHIFKSTAIPPKQQPFFCGQSVLLAHAKAYHLGKSLNLTGPISFKTNGGYKIPLTNSSEDALAVQRAWDFNEGWFANPVFVNGDYPTTLKNYTSTFLRDFTPEEKNLINGSADLFAHDAYTSQFYFAPDGGVDACLSNASNPLYPTCANSSYTYSSADGGWNIGYAADPDSPWLHIATDWVPTFLAYIQETWKPAGGVAVTEFGFAVPFEHLKQIKADILSDLPHRIYYRSYMEAVLIAISEGVNVVGCLAWSIVDNLEWTSGYQDKFGMQFVNFSSPGLERYYKASFFDYASFFSEYAAGESGGNGTMG